MAVVAVTVIAAPPVPESHDDDPPAHPTTADVSNKTAADRARHSRWFLERMTRDQWEGSDKGT
jgi:hypothetical protein